MDGNRRSRSRELERLRVELAAAGRLLDEIERRSRAQKRKMNLAAAQTLRSEIDPNDTETRFAACVSHGLAKLSSKWLANCCSRFG